MIAIALKENGNFVGYLDKHGVIMAHMTPNCHYASTIEARNMTGYAPRMYTIEFVDVVNGPRTYAFTANDESWTVKLVASSIDDAYRGLHDHLISMRVIHSGFTLSNLRSTCSYKLDFQSLPVVISSTLLDRPKAGKPGKHRTLDQISADINRKQQRGKH